MHLCTIVPISKAVGANRIYPSVAIPHPTGYPDLPAEEEKEKRYELVKKAIRTLTVDLDGPKIFK